MPWDMKSYPKAFKNLPTAKRKQAIRQAEAIRKSCVADGGSEERCARVAIATALKKANTTTEDPTIEDDVKLATPTRLQEIKQNFDSRVMPVDVAVDINHDHRRGAAAWIRKLSIKPSSSDASKEALFAEVDWTDFGTEQLGKFRYISAEFGKFVDPETGQKHTNVLKAATLTNRPFIKGMRAVSADSNEIELMRTGDFMHPIFGELNITAEEAEIVEGDDMPQEKTAFEALLEKLNITLEDGEDASEKLEAFITARAKDVTDLTAKLEEADKSLADATKKLEDIQAVGDEKDAKLTEMQEKMTKLEEQGNALATRLFEQERDIFLESMVDAGKILPKEKDSFGKLYGQDKETVVKMLSDREPVVDLEEHGTSGEDDTTLEEKIDAQAQKMVEENPDLSYRDAAIRAYAQLGNKE